jgi:TPR repeat protein
MAYLLEMYRDGLGGAKDTKKYFELLQSIANLPADDDGFVAKAQHNLSAVYSKGEIVPVNSEKEMYWLNEAAENGKMSSQEVLYSRYYYGSHGVEKKSEMVFKYAMMLAKQHKIAKYQFAVGHFYNQGIGVKRDTNEGYKWMIIAEDNGSLEAKSFVDYVEKSVNEAMK